MRVMVESVFPFSLWLFSERCNFKAFWLISHIQTNKFLFKTWHIAHVCQIKMILYKETVWHETEQCTIICSKCPIKMDL